MGQDEDFAKILDFGIAKGMGKSEKELEEGVKLTQAGMAFGTPIYMAPEQALGNPMDGRADLYAAAVIGYEMLCGQPPFYSDDKLEVMSMHTARPVPLMRTKIIKGGRPIPSSLERLIVKGLTKKPSERYASAEVFLAAVEEALQTPDGGVTDVNFERISTSTDTGRHPLVTADGRVRITGTAEFVSEDSSTDIAEAISDVLGTPHPPMKALATPLPSVGPAGKLQRKLDAPPPRGGIGIGLPYTGPTGEPIFGLTPEQRLAQVTDAHDRSIASALEPDELSISTKPVTKTTRKKWTTYAGVAAAAIALGVVIAVLTVPHGDDDAIDPGTPAGEAYALVKHGDVAKAIKLLEANPTYLATDGDAQLVMGHALSTTFETWGKSLEAYRKAIKLKPELAADEELRNSIRPMAADKRDGNLVAAAFDLWVATGDPAATTALLNAAVSEDIGRRHIVVPVIEHHKLNASVEWWRAYSLDLQQELTCPKRKEAVAKLRALGDQRAITALENAIERRARGAPKGRYNWCLLDDAKAVIGFLRGQPKKP